MSLIGESTGGKSDAPAPFIEFDRNAAAIPTSILPGLLLTGLIVAAAVALRQIPCVAAFSPMILAIVLGIAHRNFLGESPLAKLGVTFALRRLLRIAIILLGLQLTTQQVATVGATGVGVIAATLVCTFLFATWLGRPHGNRWQAGTQLIAAGTSICGASAVMATNTVTGAAGEDVAYAVASVTVFGSIAMLLYPLLAAPFHLTSHGYGLWSGLKSMRSRKSWRPLTKKALKQGSSVFYPNSRAL